jgi:hypothetical protein
MSDLERGSARAGRRSELAARRARGAAARAGVAAVVLAAAGCTETLDAGSNHPHGLLPVDERNPIVLFNDNVYDNWQGEYAMLLANGGGPTLAGIVVSTGGQWTSLDDNIKGWRALVAAAKAGGLRNIPNPTPSTVNPLLVRPESGVIDKTLPNNSEGAYFIVSESARLSLPYRPLVVVTGGRLTDVADAYLIDHSVADRVVVVSSLGSLMADAGGAMTAPNGEMDRWADTIVTAKFRYVQVSAFYDQTTDVPDSRISDLPPNNSFADWIKAKQSKIFDLPEAADQVAVAAVGIQGFATEVRRVSAVGPVDGGTPTSTTLVDDPSGHVWLVRQTAGNKATDRFWELLRNPNTFATH